VTAAPTSLRILLTNAWLDGRGGTEAVIRDLSMGLLRRGHRPIVYAPHLGELAEEMRGHGIAVIDDLSRMAEAPDVIHGQHVVQTSEALLHFPGTPAIQMCHAWQYWMEAPAQFPEIHRYVAVDQTVRDRLAHGEGVDPDKIEILLNAVDLRRFGSRQPLPARPRRALAFTKFNAHLPMVESACAHHGIELEVLGAGGDRLVSAPERELARYDLVFATARMAIEAICAGCAVVVCDSRGLAGLATTANLAQFRPLNFGLRTLLRPVTATALAEEIANYSAADAQALALSLRQEAGVESLLDRLLALYADAMAAPRADPAAQRAAMLRFVTRFTPRERTHRRWPFLAERNELIARNAQLERELAEARRAAGPRHADDADQNRL
jgi:hypothetical protein